MQSALITGGADGIGAGLTRRLSRQGFAVTIADVATHKAEALVS
jgi:NAD(P)-dependent dehydrogenase (short-subunit alcohol dehydrogenase family)